MCKIYQLKIIRNVAISQEQLIGKISPYLWGGEGRLNWQRWLCCKTEVAQMDSGEKPQDCNGSESRSRTVALQTKDV